METYKNVLVVIDEKNFTTRAISRAVNLIDRTQGRMNVLLLEQGSTLSRLSNLLHVNGQSKQNNLNQKAKLHSIINRLITKGVNINSELLISDSCDDILNKANEINIDTVIVSASDHKTNFGIHEPTIDSLLLGKCKTSLLIVNDHNWQENGQIVSAVELFNDDPDHQKLTQKVLEESEHFAQLLAGNCHTVDCYFGEYSDMSFNTRPTEKKQDTHLALMTQYCQDYHLPSESIHISSELPEQAIINVAEEIDSELVIIGDCGHRGILDKFSTHVAVEVLNKVDCDVLVLKP